MDGFVKMVQEMTEVVFAAIAVLKETGTAMIPDNFKKAVQFAWEGAVGMGNWVGYVLAGIYYLSVEMGFGGDVCEAFGYGYWVIDNIHVIVDFIPKGGPTGIDISKIATEDAKEAAAAKAKAAAEAKIKASEAAGADALQKKIDAGTATTEAKK